MSDASSKSAPDPGQYPSTLVTGVRVVTDAGNWICPMTVVLSVSE